MEIHSRSARNQRNRSPRMARQRSPARSTAARRGLSRRACAPAARGPPLRQKRAIPLPTKAIARPQPVASDSGSRPSKSPPQVAQPGVVLYAAFATPKPSASNSNCSSGSYRRGVKPPSAKPPEVVARIREAARAAAETRPGLIPQNTRKIGRETSRTSLEAVRHAAYSVADVNPRRQCGPRARQCGGPACRCAVPAPRSPAATADQAAFSTRLLAIRLSASPSRCSTRLTILTKLMPSPRRSP